MIYNDTGISLSLSIHMSHMHGSCIYVYIYNYIYSKAKNEIAANVHQLKDSEMIIPPGIHTTGPLYYKNPMEIK